MRRFWKSMIYFNQVQPIGSIYEFSRLEMKNKSPKKKPLVKFVAYCLNPNHYHFILSPLQEKGIEKFMQRLGNGFTKYFNNKYKRSGVLFQGKFKSKHIDSNEYLLHLSAYINTNDRFGHRMSKLSKSSLREFVEDKHKHPKNPEHICDKDIILGQFRNKKDYENFVLESLKDINLRKEMTRELGFE